MYIQLIILFYCLQQSANIQQEFKRYIDRNHLVW